MIDLEVQAALRDKFNPEGSDARRVQLLLLDMLRYIDRICRENKIEYWLSSGTLIGAVRHGGFIPWDDDVDVEMMPDGLERFIEAVNCDKTSRYVIHNHDNDPNFIFTFTKLRDLGTMIFEKPVVPQPLRYQGCAIDLFTMVPSNSRRLHVWARKVLGKEMTVWRSLYKRPRRLQRIIQPIVDSLVRRVMLPFLGALSRIGAGSQLRHSMSAPFHAPRRKEEIFPLSTVSFEGYKFPAPGNTDAYLRRIYGDYMKIPSVEEIQVHASRIDFI